MCTLGAGASVVWAPLPLLALHPHVRTRLPDSSLTFDLVRGWPCPHPHLDTALNEGALQPWGRGNWGVALWGMGHIVAEEGAVP